MRLPRRTLPASSVASALRASTARRPPCSHARFAGPSFEQCSTSGRGVPAAAALAMPTTGNSKTSPVQDQKYSRTAPEKAKELDGNDIPFDINDWVPGQVHEVKSPAEFKAFVLERSSERPVIMMCKARACRPCKVFARTYSKFATANPEVIFLTVVGDETPALRRMMVLLGVKSTPFFVTYRNAEQIHQHGGNSDEKLQKALDIAYATMDDAAQPPARKEQRSMDEGDL